MLHKNFAMLTSSFTSKLIKVRGKGETYGLIDQAVGDIHLRKKWFEISRKEKSRWEDNYYQRGAGVEPPTLGGWRCAKFKFDEPPQNLIGVPCIIRICTEKPRKPHPTLGDKPRWVVYVNRMTGPSDQVVRVMDVWRNKEDFLFDLPQIKGQYGRFFWSHSLSLFDDHDEYQMPRLVIYHPILKEIRPDSWNDNETTIIEKAKNRGIEL